MFKFILALILLTSFDAYGAKPKIELPEEPLMCKDSCPYPPKKKPAASASKKEELKPHECAPKLICADLKAKDCKKVCI